MARSKFRVAAVAVALTLCGTASAERIQSSCPYYYPIRASGAACNGPNAIAITGTSACCIAAPSAAPRSGMPRTGSINIPAGSDRYAAGLAIGIVGLAIVLDLLDLFGPSTVGDAAPQSEYDALRDRARGERDDARTEAARWHAAALREVRKGDMRSADGFLFKAMKLARGANEFELAGQYELELYAVRATQTMKEGLALQAEGNLKAAEKQFERAAYFAQFTGRPELSKRIFDYRISIASQMPKGVAPPRAKAKIAPRSTCVEANGQLMCEN